MGVLIGTIFLLLIAVLFTLYSYYSEVINQFWLYGLGAFICCSIVLYPVYRFYKWLFNTLFRLNKWNDRKLF